MYNKEKKSYTAHQALIKAQKYCAYQERCHTEMRSKLYEWGMDSDDSENIICELIADNFLNEERFAKAYAGGKFRIKKWGRIKILGELKKRQISDYCIKLGMKEIEDEDYLHMLTLLIEKRALQVKEKNPYIRKNKIVTYIQSKGYEYDLIADIMKELKIN